MLDYITFNQKAVNNYEAPTHVVGHLTPHTPQEEHQQIHRWVDLRRQQRWVASLGHDVDHGYKGGRQREYHRGGVQGHWVERAKMGSGCIPSTRPKKMTYKEPGMQVIMEKRVVECAMIDLKTVLNRCYMDGHEQDHIDDVVLVRGLGCHNTHSEMNPEVLVTPMGNFSTELGNRIVAQAKSLTT
ncbi:hypothetical protein F53441_12910 [Fusarium austroafricanum]|uniref:Uncharacterized protein n=1 Tax=Fusarium austroafricanum TaxID=2364996 RepID=A0A8H4JW16_9HYPO|nr:hypothetical protein F53441_12910 [Fusarium austroafricanum]